MRAQLVFAINVSARPLSSKPANETALRNHILPSRADLSGAFGPNRGSGGEDERVEPPSSVPYWATFALKSPADTMVSIRTEDFSFQLILLSIIGKRDIIEFKADMWWHFGSCHWFSLFYSCFTISAKDTFIWMASFKNMRTSSFSILPFAQYSFLRFCVSE